MRLCPSLAALAAATMVALVANDASAQARIGGQVTDEWDNPLEGVTVTAERDEEGGASRTATTDSDGRFQVTLPLSRAEIGNGEARHLFTFTLDGYQGIRTPANVSLSNNRPIDIELEVVSTGGRLRGDSEFEAEGGTPRIKFGEDGRFEFKDADGEGEGTYGIVELSAVLVVRDYNGSDETYSLKEPVVVTFANDQFASLTWGDATLTKR